MAFKECSGRPGGFDILIYIFTKSSEAKPVVWGELPRKEERKTDNDSLRVTVIVFCTSTP